MMVAVIATSCILDDTTLSDDFGKSKSVVGFETNLKAVSVKADGEVHEQYVALEISGPTVEELNDDVIVTYSIDESSTAIAGTHYTLEPGNLTLQKSNNFKTVLPFSVITEGMDPPMETKLLVINLNTVTSGGVVINDRLKQITVKIDYLCASDLAGDYVMHFTSGDTFITVTQISEGNYRSDYLPTFASRYWFEFSDVCGDLSITDWQYQGGNPISPFNTVVGHVDEDGNLVFEGITVDGVSWYVDLDFTILKN